MELRCDVGINTPHPLAYGTIGKPICLYQYYLLCDKGSQDVQEKFKYKLE